MSISFERHRRLRKTPYLREMVKETRLEIEDLIYPLFIKEGLRGREPIESMPGINRLGLDVLEEEVIALKDLGILSVIVFGIPLHKDGHGSGAYDEQGIVQEAIRRMKKVAPELVIIADTCLCEFTDHGHCGLVQEGEILNDVSLEVLTQVAISQAKAGADIIAPSNAMDGYVYAIREGLDKAGFLDVPILSYAIKFASSYYGPFRDAANSAPQFGDRRSYQMDIANRREALREVDSDVKQGADMVMVKPALAFLDIIRDVRERVNLPIVAYSVSGEYSMMKLAAREGLINEQALVIESLTGMKRAGADLIITYYAKELALWLRK